MSIYADIARRCGGEIYIGVVGPVRTGKSAFIKRFMETLVIPNIEPGYDRDRARDELPQSAGGRTVMTTEPKFIPDEAVQITAGDAHMKVRLVDCVGYVIPEALGQEEDGSPRMVRTPWSESPVPFVEAAETGTRRVITDHSTIGFLVTTDGTVGDIPRSSYVAAEERVAKELREMGKPFAVILNSAAPDTPEAVQLASSLEEKYGAPVALVNCLDLDAEDIRQILELVLYEFPVSELTINIPGWMNALPQNHTLRTSIKKAVGECAAAVNKMGDVKAAFAAMAAKEGMADIIEDVTFGQIDAGTGCATMNAKLKPDVFYKTISDVTGLPINSDEELMQCLRDLAVMKSEYDRYAEAIEDVKERGYGIVMPDIDDLTLEEPEIVRQSGGYGVRLRASAPSVHMIKTNIETELNPIVGTEQQSEELVKYMLREFDGDKKKIWESNLFGKSLYELVSESLHTKLGHMPEDARAQLSETLSRVINEGSNGLVCILL